MKKILYLLLVLIFISCSKTENKEEKKSVKKEESIENEITYTPKIKIEKVKELNVENFVKIYLSKMEQEIMWIIKMRKTTKGKDLIESDADTGDTNSFIKQKKEFEDNFFNSWGISQKEFEEFADKNAEKVEKYLNNNHEMQKLLEEIQKINEKLYNSEEVEDEMMSDNHITNE